jgi:hypothetical protein
MIYGLDLFQQREKYEALCERGPPGLETLLNPVITVHLGPKRRW